MALIYYFHEIISAVTTLLLYDSDSESSASEN